VAADAFECAAATFAKVSAVDDATANAADSLRDQKVTPQPVLFVDVGAVTANAYAPLHWWWFFYNRVGRRPASCSRPPSAC
jgi:anti-sigma factor RsiW